MTEQEKYRLQDSGRVLARLENYGWCAGADYLAAALDVVKAELHRRSVYATTPPFSVERGEAMAAADAALDAALDRWED